MSPRGWSWLAIAMGLAAIGGAACGGAGAGGGRRTALEPATFLAEVGGEASPVLRRPERSVEELEATRRAARGTERRAAGRDVAVARMFAAEGLEGRAARRARRELDQAIAAARQGPRDAALDREIDFVALWSAWRAGARTSGRLAERYTTRHRQAGGPLLTLAWMIRGEVALEAGDEDDAIEAYRFALGQLDSPLYGYALLRTARAHRQAGRLEEARQALSEVERLGCDARASAPVRQLAAAAASEQGTGMRTDDGVEVPRSCPERTAGGEGAGEEAEWRPEE